MTSPKAMARKALTNHGYARRPSKLRSKHVPFRPPVGKRPQPDAVRRINGNWPSSWASPTRSSTADCPSCWPTASSGRSLTAPSTCRRVGDTASQPTGSKRPPTSWTSTRPRTSCGPTPCPGVADAAHPQDGCRGRRLPPGRHDIPREGRAEFPRGISPPGALRRRHNPPRRPGLRHRPPGAGPTQALPPRQAAGLGPLRLSIIRNIRPANR